MGREIETRLHFSYEMLMTYEEAVRQAYFTIKGCPKSTARQEISGIEITMEPEVRRMEGTDSFGNIQVYGSTDCPHRLFRYRISGQARIGQILYEEKAAEEEIWIYRHPHGLNRPGPALEAYFDSLKGQLEENAYVNAVFLMRTLHREFSYRKGITHAGTTAEEAWMLGGGVCQDYAHIFIALCQMAGIPARYVTGLITGEGASHAWAEILYHGKWIGMDPTNDLLVAGFHIKFGHGRDAGDCLINRGILRGGGAQHQEIRVSVTEMAF